jgi:signal transduction histidine kinase
LSNFHQSNPINSHNLKVVGSNPAPATTLNILINLLANAIRVTKARGSIGVEVARAASAGLCLTVRDDGPEP